MSYLEDHMAERITEARVREVLAEKPQLFDALMKKLVGSKPEGDRYYPLKASNKANRLLQKLKKKGEARYLKKADGGPGWVRA